MKRRGFLAALAAVPFLRRFVKAAPGDEATFFAADRTVDSSMTDVCIDGCSAGMALAAIEEIRDAQYQAMADAWERSYERTLNELGVFRTSSGR